MNCRLYYQAKHVLSIMDNTPPVPTGGIPPGWTMEQWTHYGAEYLRRQGGS